MDARDYPEAYLEENGTRNHVLDRAAKEIRKLRADLAEANAEIERLKSDNETHWQNGADFTKQIVELEQKLAEKDAELERERIRLAACGVVAISDTPESAAASRQMNDEYRSASCDDVARRVDECMQLRQQLAEANAKVEGLYKRLSVFSRRAINEQLAEANAEIQKLTLDCLSADGQAMDSWTQLAASQAREQQYREALDAVQQVANRSDGIAGWHLNGDIASWESILPEVEQAIALQQDTTALEAMIAKSGEVMRERAAASAKLTSANCVTDAAAVGADRCELTIRALPGVTLGDLK